MIQKTVKNLDSHLYTYKDNVPFGGYEKALLGSSTSFLSTRLSCIDPGHPAKKYVNSMSKSQIGKIFFVEYPFYLCKGFSLCMKLHIGYVYTINGTNAFLEM